MQSLVRLANATARLPDSLAQQHQVFFPRTLSGAQPERESNPFNTYATFNNRNNSPVDDDQLSFSAY